MNKLLTLLFPLLILIISGVFAQALSDLGESANKIKEQAEKAKETGEKLRDANATTEYLKKEWREILEENKAGRVLLGISDFIKNFNPLFKIILGVEYSLSWAFIFAIAIWLGIFILIVNPLSVLVNNRLSGIIIAVAVTSLISISGTIKKTLDLLAFIIDNKWAVWLSLAIAVILVLTFNLIGKSMANFLKKKREESDRDQTNRDRRIIHTDAEVSEENLEDN